MPAKETKLSCAVITPGPRKAPRKNTAFQARAKRLLYIGALCVVVTPVVKLVGARERKPGLEVPDSGALLHASLEVARIVESGFGGPILDMVLMGPRWRAGDGRERGGQP